MKLVFYIKSKIPRKVAFYLRKIISEFEYIPYTKYRKKIFSQQKKAGINSIPIFIISYNRLEYLDKMINRLEQMGKKNIVIIDNASTYAPLLEYYKKISYKVIRLKENGGHMVFWNNSVFEKYRRRFYIVSDPDIVPIDECPEDFIEYFFKYLEKYPFVRKVGFSLKIDDIPEKSIFRDELLKWEKKYNKPLVEKGKLYYADIDTTFALYVPDQLVYSQPFCRAFRTSYPYQARHLPWYKTSDMITDEDVFYSQHKKNGWWDVARGTVTPDNK